MNLADRLAAAHGQPTPSSESAPAAVVPLPRPAVAAPVTPAPVDALARLKDRVGKALFERMGSRMNDPNLSAEQLRTIVLGELDEVVEEENVPLSTEERARLTAELADDVLGYGPLQRLLDDDSVSEIMVNGPENIYVERNGKLTRTGVCFTPRSTCAGSSTASSRGWAGGSTSRRRWSTRAWPTARVSTRSSRRWRSAGRR